MEMSGVEWGQGEGAWQRNTEDGETRMGNGWTGGRWSDVEGGTWLWESWGAKKCDGNGWCGMGVGAQGEVHDGVRGGCRAAQSRVKSGGQGAGCSSGGMLGGVQGEMWSEARGGRRSGRRCGAGWRWDGMGRGKNGVRNHFGRHFTNIVYIIKKMF